MKITVALTLIFGFSSAAYCQDCASAPSNPELNSVLRQAAPVIVLRNENMFDGLAKLDQQVHLAIAVEAIPGVRRDQYPRFVKEIKGESIRVLMDELVALDPRYRWSVDSSTINVFPRSLDSDVAYLPSRRIAVVTLANSISAEDAFSQLLRQAEDTALLELTGTDYNFPKPWSVSFQGCTVRQAFNRITEHLGGSHGWQFTQTPKGDFKRLVLHAGLGHHPSSNPSAENLR